MEVLRGWSGPPRGPAAVTIGKFTIVHRGHAVLLERTVAAASRLGITPAAVTFDPDPAEVLAPDRAPSCRLATLDQRLEALGAAGMKTVLLLEFTKELAALEPEEFVDRAIVRALGARTVVVGEDFRFGRGRRGDAGLLRKLGRGAGFDVDTVGLVAEGGEKVSSSAVREHLAGGRVEEAARLLGRCYAVRGEVVRGDARGRDLGFPTANLRPSELACLPAAGVYAGFWSWRGRRLPGAVNVGLNPTFETLPSPRVEIFILDFDGDLYGETGDVEFATRLRDERRFASVDELVVQIGRDVERARGLLGA